MSDRKKQIKDAAELKFTNHFASHDFLRDAFRIGAEWADKNPVTWPHNETTILRNKVAMLEKHLDVAIDALKKVVSRRHLFATTPAERD